MIARRKLVRMIAACLSVVGTHRVTSRSALAESAGWRQRAEAVLGPYANLKSLAVVGRNYVRQYPAEADPQLMLSRLVATIAEAKNRFGQMSMKSDRNEATKRAIRAAISADFSDGRIVIVNGWILAETEARACALAAFLDDQAGGRSLVG
jgi:hypothetical protein